MKQAYRKYGEYIGFDLTFSLIREKPEMKAQMTKDGKIK